ncbi:APC membrane recruitment protein 2 [Hoplias malabaricus]|uniref:APC membrane recruitment protein 2 n=1 Tax=Hoplias malabaricus TaxID=27720 RepID=UPI0034623353
MMEAQSDCIEPPPCEPQPSGKINKAAFKLFGKRRSGSGMPSIFSIRNKGEGGSKTSGKDLIRSKTHDGLTTDIPAELEGHKKEESASSDQLNSASVEGVSIAPVRSAITKSFSFFSLLRRNSTRVGDGTATLGHRGRGLKGLFSSMRWRRKPPPRDDSSEVQEVAKEVKEGDIILPSNSNSVDNLKENVTLTLEPSVQVFEECPAADHSGSWKKNSLQELERSNGECEKSSSSLVEEATEEAIEESPAPSPIRVQTGGPLRAKHSGPACLTSIPTSAMTPPLEHSSVDPPSEPSVDRLCSMFTDVTSLKSFDSLTGCGDIIADPEEDSGNGGSATSSGTGSSSGGCGGRRVIGAATERCSPAKPPLPPQVASLTAISPYISHQRMCPPPKKPQGSGIVAYMGGGEEMASPEGVDDADMQGLWHMLPQKEENSPALPRADPILHHPQVRQDKKPPQVKGLGLSKIPVSGISKAGKQQSARPSPPPIDKDLQDAPPSDEGYWDSPTPGPEDEDSGFPRRDGLLRDSCSGDALYDLYDLDSPGAAGSDDELSSPTPSTGDLKMSPPSKNPSSSSSSSFRSIKGSTSLPRDSKIPISVKQATPSHSSSQGALSSSVSPTSGKPSTKTNTPARTRIPVSKVPVRRSGNKNINTTQNRK